MSTTEGLKRATDIAQTVYSDFLEQVIDGYVLNDREGKLSEDMKKRVDKGTHIDPRVLRLMSISGKGGWDPDPDKNARYAENTNITLLDHLLSVTRGSLMLIALDLLSQNPDMDEIRLRRFLHAAAAIAFMHDLDKDLELPRNATLTVKHVQERMQRYGLDTFLEAAGCPLNGAQMLYLLERVEATQSHKSDSANAPRELDAITQYIRLADKLDGQWVKAGLPGVLGWLEKEKGSIQSDFLSAWHSIEVFDPHHPFLLDDLQLRLSSTCRDISGALPLLEVHQDGRLFMLLPAEQADAIIQQGIQKTCAKLPFDLRLDVSVRGIPALYDGRPDHATLQDFVEKLSHKQLGDLLKISSKHKAEVQDALDEMLDDIDLLPRWSKKPGGLISLYDKLDDLDSGAMAHLYRAAHLALLLNLKLEAKSKDNIPTPTEREAILLGSVDATPPDWLSAVADDTSRRTLLALWTVAAADEAPDIEDAVWDEDGLLQSWLEGSDDNAPFRDFISGRGPQVQAAVATHFNALLGGERLVAKNPAATGRCLFTDQPIAFDDSIDQALGLYGVKVSAFSGREGRPESVNSDRSHTNVSPVSIAEYKLRALAHEIQGGRENGIPSLITVPVTSGLFGGLRLTNEEQIQAMSVYDLSRQEIKKGKVYRGTAVYKQRHRMNRLERMAEKTEDQITQLRMLLQATRRIGRPLHIFRGLPTLQKAFFYYDAMPRMMCELLGSNELRLEQLPLALQQLELAEGIMNANGLGYDALRLYAAPDTRFSGICLACNVLSEQGNKTLTRRLMTEYKLWIEEGRNMSETEGALVRLGRAAAGIQSYVGSGDSANKQMMVFKLCMDTVNGARKLGQTDTSSLTMAVAGELETNLIRRQEAASKENRAGKTLLDGCREVAELFVHDVWLQVLKSHAPSQSNRRILGSIYRMAFLQQHQILAAERRANAGKET